MIQWIILGVYLLGWFASVPITAPFIMRHIIGEDDGVDVPEKVMALALAVSLGTLWPLLIPGVWLYGKIFAKGDHAD